MQTAIVVLPLWVAILLFGGVLAPVVFVFRRHGGSCGMQFLAGVLIVVFCLVLFLTRVVALAVG